MVSFFIHRLRYFASSSFFLYRPSDRRLSAKLVTTFADRVASLEGSQTALFLMPEFISSEAKDKHDRFQGHRPKRMPCLLRYTKPVNVRKASPCILSARRMRRAYDTQAVT
jgi:hypothetical protein